MKLRGIEFGRVLNASGAQGFYGEGYPFHRLGKYLGLTYEGCTFVAKTTTIDPRLDPAKKLGNLPLKSDGITPKELIPKCIVVKPFKKVVLNAVGLSGPGAKVVIERNRYRHRKPFLLSFMSVAPTLEDRLLELERFVSLLSSYLSTFTAPVGLEINFSCPNVGLHAENLLREIHLSLESAGRLGIPLIPKISVMVLPEMVWEIANHPQCDAICCSNTIPWGQLPHRIDWKGLFGSDVSPLQQFGGGGLSGEPLLLLVKEWLASVCTHRLSKPINAGGGILYPIDATSLQDLGASAISPGVISILRPWNMGPVIRAATKENR